MPQASSAPATSAKYWLKDHDTAYLNEVAPIKNQWYTVLQAQDVRILTFAFMETDLLAQGCEIEVRWTLDGNIYLYSSDFSSGTQIYISRTKYPSIVGGLAASTGVKVLAMLNTIDKRALDAKLEVRIISDTLPTDILNAWCVYETLEVT
jgi:hypothetical protein